TISTDSVFVLSISKHSSRTDIYTLPLHDALPISHVGHRPQGGEGLEPLPEQRPVPEVEPELSRHLVAGHPLGTFQKARLGLVVRSEEHTSELQSRENLVCRLLLEKKKQTQIPRSR